MNKWYKNISSIIKETGKEFTKHNPLLIGAAISFYVLLSLGPILFLIIFSLGSIFGEKAIEGQIVNEIKNLVGDKPAQIIQTLIEKAYKFPSKTITLITSIPLLFFGGTMVFYQLRNALNIIWEVEPSEESNGIVKKTKNYFFSIVMLLIVGFLIFLLVLKSPAIKLLQENIPLSGVTIDILDFVLNFVVLIFLFGMIYRILPAVDIKWSDVWIGAAVTSFLFSIVQILVGVNISNTNPEDAAGAIGSFTILFLWIFYSSLIFLFGANFTKVYAKKKRSFNK
ncbi:MAG: YihY/virulence factor BrkB family protein [Ignavibacteriales bacterium]|nr:MAG: YihY/virulence factor BrkB family protein [Ignavibacteriales bacterium]